MSLKAIIKVHAFAISLLLSIFFIHNPLFATVGDCPEGQYKYCDGECPSEHTDQGECTTRREQQGTDVFFWCCCYDDYDPHDSYDETTTTTGGPSKPVDIGECPPSKEIENGGKGPEPKPWAISAAIQKTDNPAFTDDVLRSIRDNVLEKSQRGKKYVKATYRLGDDVNQILSKNPELAVETATFLNDNLSLLVSLGKNQEIAISRDKMKEARALLRKYAQASGENDALKKVIDRALEDLKNRRFLKSLGIQVQK